MGYRKEDRVQGSIPEYGAIFMSNSATRKECFERQLLGLPSGKGSFVKQVKDGMVLFLFEFEKRELHGVFLASSDGAMNIVPNAFSSSGMQFPAQVRFTQIWHCSPLREHEFRDAIKENYFSNYKFNFGLSRDQVRRLLELFETRRLESKLPRQSVIREDKLIGDNERVAATNLGTTDDSRFLKSDARENNKLISDHRREYENTMEYSRTSFNKRKRYPDSQFPMQDGIDCDHDMNLGNTISRSGREGEGSQFLFAHEYPEDSVSKVRRASQDGSFLTRKVILDKHYASSGGCGLAARSGFENAGDEDRRTNDDRRYIIDHRTEINHNLDDVPEEYYPADYHGSPLDDVRKRSGFAIDRSGVELIGDNDARYPVNPLEKVRKAFHDDRYLSSDRVETARNQFVEKPDVEWSARGHGKLWGNVYLENDPKFNHGFEDTSTLYAGYPLEEARSLGGEAILPRFDRLHDGYNVKTSPRPNLPIDYTPSCQPPENPSFCSSKTISQTDFSFGPYKSKTYPGLQFSHSASYDTVPTRSSPYEPKVLDIHHRHSPHAMDSSLLQPMQKFSPHPGFIESPHLSLTKQTLPPHLEAEESSRHLHLRDARGSYGPEALDIHSKQSSHRNNSLFQNYPHYESHLTSLGRRTSPSFIQDEDASRYLNLEVTNGPYDSEVLGSRGKYSSYVGDNSIHQQIQNFPPNVSSIASNLISSKKQSPPYHLQAEHSGHQLDDTFHQFQSCHKPSDYNPSGRTSNLLFGTEYNMEPKSFEQYEDRLSSGLSGSMPFTSAGINDYKNIQHESDQMSSFMDAGAAAAKGDSYLRHNLSSERSRKHNSKYNQSSKDLLCASPRRREIDQRSSRTSVFDRITSGSKLRASNDTCKGYDNSDADASVDEIMEALYQNLNHPGTKKAKVTSVDSQHNRELPWAAKHVKTHWEVLSDKPGTMMTELKNETKQVIVDGDSQIREDTRVVEFNRRSKKKIQDSTDPKSCVQNAEIRASSSVQVQENEISGGKVVNKRRKLVRPTFGKKEELNDELTNNGDSVLQLTSPEPSSKETGCLDDSGEICKDDNHPSSLDPFLQSALPICKGNAANETHSNLVEETNSGKTDKLGSVSEGKELHEDVNGDQATNTQHPSHANRDSTTKEHNTGSSEKDSSQTTILQYSSLADADSCLNEKNTGCSEKDALPQSVHILQVAGMSAGEASYNNADSLDCRNSSFVDGKASVMIKTEN